MNLPDIVETAYKNGYKDGVKDIKQAIRELIDTEFKSGVIRCINCGEVIPSDGAAITRGLCRICYLSPCQKV